MPQGGFRGREEGRLFSPLVGRNLPLEEFPSLFAMQGHIGVFGLLFASLWFAYVGLYIPSVVTAYWLYAGVIVAAFFVLVWVCFFLTEYFARAIYDSDAEVRNKLAFKVRWAIAVMIVNCVIIIGVLIWLTGGVRSPFIPFYIIVFTFTISRMTVPLSARTAVFFVITLLLACVARELWPLPISHVEMLFIQERTHGIHIALLCASLAGPTVSFYFIARRERGRRRWIEHMNQVVRNGNG
jgi:hypothetical protein